MVKGRESEESTLDVKYVFLWYYMVKYVIPYFSLPFFALSVFFIVARERQSQVVEESVVGDFASNEISPYNASRYIYGEPTESYKGT